MAEIEVASDPERAGVSDGDAREASVVDEEPEESGTPRQNGEVFDEESLEVAERKLLEVFQRLRAEHPRVVSAAAALLVLFGASLFECRCTHRC